MHYIADLHLHSHYAYATSKLLQLETIHQWAQIKGIHVIGTGDFTHPGWLKDLKEKLVPDGNGFYFLKEPSTTPALLGLQPSKREVRFCLSSEVSCIYKDGNRIHKGHYLLYVPDIATAVRINSYLSKRGDLNADGRPILNVSARNLLEIVLTVSRQAHLIPAHVWTPWFSILGSKAGYNSIEACFQDLSSHIFALETGLSSDPAMNWQWSKLDKYAMVSNSDAHSLQNIGREATLFDTSLSYDGLFNALRTKKGFLGTLEFFPQEGKYYLDGHRKCKVCMTPQETKKYKGKCPVCGMLVTVGVLHRVLALADRSLPKKPAIAPNFQYIIPLMEIIAEISQKGVKTKTVQNTFVKLINLFGDEFTFLRHTPIATIEKHLGSLYATALHRLRNHLIDPQPGYDGEYGKIQLLKAKEKQIATQIFFSL